MQKRSPATSARLIAPAVLLVVGLSVMPLAGASQPPTERSDLATIVRELNLIDQLAVEGESAAPNRGRYHFDYVRLHKDIARVRAGIKDYLSPPRAQPRDSRTVSGQYRADTECAP